MPSVFHNKSYVENIRRIPNGCDINDIDGKLKAKKLGNNVRAWSEACKQEYKISCNEDKDCVVAYKGNGYKQRFKRINPKALLKLLPVLAPMREIAAEDLPTTPSPLKIAVEILIQPTEDSIGQYEGGVGEQNLVVLPSEESVAHPTEESAAKPTEDGARDEAPNIKSTEDELKLEGDVHLNAHKDVLPSSLLKAKSASVSKKKCKHRSN